MTNTEFRRLHLNEWAEYVPPAFPSLGRFSERLEWVRWRLSPRAARLFVCWTIAKNTEPDGPGSSWEEHERETILRTSAEYAVGKRPYPLRPMGLRRFVVPMGTRPHRQPVVIDSLWDADAPYSDAARCGMYEPGLLALYARPDKWRASWETEDVRGLAAAANADPLSPRQDLAPILADALEEAGVDGEAADLWLHRLRSHQSPLLAGSWVLEYGRLAEGRPASNQEGE